MTRTGRISHYIRHPQGLPLALARMLRPAQGGLGRDWFRTVDGAISFKENGFVAASSPSSLLARHNYEVAAINTVLEHESADSLLEIGCGFGRLSMALSAHSSSHTAVDVNPDAVALARRCYPSIDFRVSSATELPFQDETMSVVVTWTVLQHIPVPQITLVADEICRVLKPGGLLLICEETARAGAKSYHSWHRSPADYDGIFSALTRQITRSPWPENLDLGVDQPGTVMTFRKPTV